MASALVAERALFEVPLFLFRAAPPIRLIFQIVGARPRIAAAERLRFLSLARIPLLPLICRLSPPRATLLRTSA